MKITEISRSFSRKIQTQQFENADIFSSYKGELDGTETEEEVKAFSNKLFSMAQHDVEEEVTRLMRVKELAKSMEGEPFKSEDIDF